MSGRFSTRLDAALTFADRGWPVFPCNGKHPLTDHGLHDATTDRRQIEALWRRHADANIAIRAGIASNLVVLDVDGDDGTESLRGLGRRLGRSSVSELDVVADRSGWVVITFQWEVRGDRSGAATTANLAAAYRLTNGKMCEAHFRWTAAQALEAAGLEE
jgi:Bifunctional DNA primase/polymerase, N-terminal